MACRPAYCVHDWTRSYRNAKSHIIVGFKDYLSTVASRIFFGLRLIDGLYGTLVSCHAYNYTSLLLLHWVAAEPAGLRRRLYVTGLRWLYFKLCEDGHGCNAVQKMRSYLQVIRFVMIFLMLPVLSRLGYGLTWREAIILAWGGLRGAVGLALALFVSLDNQIADTRFTVLTFFFVSAIVLLTLLIQGSTTPLLLQVIMSHSLHGIR